MDVTYKIKNKFRVRGDVVEIVLNRRHEDDVVAKIDKQVFDELVGPLELKWQARWNDCAWTYYVQARIGKNPSVFLQLHRLILGIQDQSHLVVVGNHLNFNGLDNRRSNLEAVTRAKNQQHSRKCRSNTSGYPNVCWAKNENKWKGYFQYTIDGKRTLKHVGYFEDPKVAYDVTQKAKKEFLAALT